MRRNNKRSVLLSRALIKMFLVAPVIDDREGGAPRRPKAGTPQGGVISPLLANIYLHLLDRSYRRRVERGEFEGRLIRYCDDFVLLTRQHPSRELSWLQAMMARMGLALHPDKTRVVDTRKERFDFLGYRVGWRRQQLLLLDLSPKSLDRIHERLRQPTTWTFLSIDKLVAILNRYIGGARAYFRLAPWWSLRTVDSFVEMRMAKWWTWGVPSQFMWVQPTPDPVVGASTRERGSTPIASRDLLV